MTNSDFRMRVAVISLAASFVLTASGVAADEWGLVHSTCFTSLVPAGERCCISVNPAGTFLEVELPDMNLTAAAEAAVDVAPEWLKRDLTDNFRRLGEDDQNLFGGFINDALPPYVDEICFEVAHLAPQTLAGMTHPEVLIENVESLYSIDSSLGYADIVDYDNGGDYYSTIVYYVEEGGETLEVELPRDKYYWYVVHPKLHKEAPEYINPESGFPADPPTGVFWRDYLMNQNDSGYPLLRTALESRTVLWKSRQNDLDNGAVGALTQWIKDVMTFQSNPHHSQPVRIYHQHIGTCSVHSYLTSAAARAALIPAAVNVMYSDNHKINEFWDRRWIAWEPVNTYIDYPEGYENWGWNIAAAFNWRGDSFIWDETEMYTEVCTLDVSVTDSDGRPVDGGRIKIFSTPCVSWGATAAWTGSDGLKRILLGDSRIYRASVNSSIGDYPTGGGMITIISGSVAGANYTWDVTLPGAVSELDASPDTMPSNPTNLYRLVVEYNLPAEILYGDNFDDGGRFSEPSTPGHIDFFVCDEEEFTRYAAGDSFMAFEIALGSMSDTVDFTLPAFGPWHAVLSNESNLVMTQDLHVTAKLYANATGVENGRERGGPPAKDLLCANYPNPFNPETRITFVLSHAGETELSIYNVSGRKVRTLMDGFRAVGEHSAVWNGEDDNGNAVSSGIYLYKLRTDHYSDVRRMLLVR